MTEYVRGDVSGNTATQTRSVSRPMDETFRYDGNGNLTNWVSGTTNWVYEWDWADRLSKVSSNGITVLENWYDARSRRLAKKDAAYALYLWDGWESLAVLNQSGVAQEIFTRGIGLAGDIGTLVAVTKVSTPAIYYAHHNHRGDVTTVRYGTTTTATYDYSAYGNLVSWTGTDVCRFKFSSKERESSCGWSYYGYRFYAPQWQRWVSREPLEDAGGPNMYLFALNDPPGHLDAFGMKPRKGPTAGGLENDSESPLPCVDLDNKQCAIVPPGEKTPPGHDWDFVLLPDGTWWKIGMGELDIGADGTPKWGQINHRKATAKEAGSCEAIYPSKDKGRKNERKVK